MRTDRLPERRTLWRRGRGRLSCIAALAVAVGYQHQGFLGTVVALVALVLLLVVRVPVIAGLPLASGLGVVVALVIPGASLAS